VSISSRELAGPASGRTAQPAQPAKTLPGKAPTAIHQGMTHTRDQLTDTVEALANKMGLPVRVKDKVRQTKDTVQATVGEVRQHLHKSTETLQDKAGEVKSLTNQALAKVPTPGAGRIDGLMERVRHRPLPAAAVVLGVLVVLRRLLWRNK
jgi:gas vesicle protein